MRGWRPRPRRAPRGTDVGPRPGRCLSLLWRPCPGARDRAAAAHAAPEAGQGGRGWRTGPGDPPSCPRTTAFSPASVLDTATSLLLLKPLSCQTRAPPYDLFNLGRPLKTLPPGTVTRRGWDGGVLEDAVPFVADAGPRFEFPASEVMNSRWTERRTVLLFGSFVQQVIRISLSAPRECVS